MDIITIVIYTTATIEIILGAVVLLSDKNNRVNQLFFIVTITTAYWIVSNALITLPPSDFWVRNAYATGILIAPVILIWSIRFITKKKVDPLKTIIILGTAIFFCFVTYFSTLIIKDVGTNLTGGFDGKFGILFPLFALYFITVNAYILFLVTRAFWNSDGLEKIQYGYVAFGLYGFGLIATIVDFVLPIFGINFLIVLDSPSSIFFIAAMSFAILKHQLFNVKVIATELLTFTLWIFILIRALVSTTTQDRIINGGLFIITVAVGILLIRSVIKEVKLREKIQELSDQKSDFMSFASHELRNPLTFIKGVTSEILEGDFGDMTPLLRDAIGKIYIRGNDDLQLIQQYLDKSKFELGELKYQFATMDMKELVAQTIDYFKHHLEQKKVTISFTSDAGPHTVNADRGKIQEVLGNLVDNAIKYSPDNANADITLEHKENKVILKVKDAGKGISKDTMDKLFQKFARAEDAAKFNIKGSGLGLYLARLFIEAHKGRIFAESEGAGKGSTFVVELPVT